MTWLDGITNSMDMSLGELRVQVMNRESWRAAIHGVTKSQTRLSGCTELSSFHVLIGHLKELQKSNMCQIIKIIIKDFKLLLFSFSVLSDSLRPHGVQHARPPCSSLSPGLCLNSCPSTQRCHPTISSSVVPSPPAFYHSVHQGLFQ